MSSETKKTSNSGGGGRGGGGHGKKESILELAKVRERSLLGAALMLMGLLIFLFQFHYTELHELSDVIVSHRPFIVCRFAGSRQVSWGKRTPRSTAWIRRTREFGVR